MSYGNYAPFYRGGFFNPMQTPQMPNMAETANQYAQPYQQPMQTQPAPMPMPQSNDMMIWVLNESDATSYPVAPNNSVVLWDKNNPTIYVKSVNAQGMPSMRILDFVERTETHEKRTETHECACISGNFATKEQISELQGKIDDLAAKYERIVNAPDEKPKVTLKKAKEADE